MTEIERRVAAVKKTDAHFAGQPFSWGRVDCAKVIAWHLRQLGYRSIGIAKAGNYQSALSAKRALKRWGIERLSDAFDKLGLEQIGVASVLPGDILASDGSEGHEAICIYCGNQMMLGFVAENMQAGVQMIRIVDVNALRAWRV